MQPVNSQNGHQEKHQKSLTSLLRTSAAVVNIRITPLCIARKMRGWIQSSAFYCSLLLPSVWGVHDSLNMILPPGGQECFFEEFFQDSQDREVDIFIPQNGNVDIVLKIYGPLKLSQVQLGSFSNLILTETVDAADQVESESQSFVQEFSPDVPGIYAFCVDNSRSRFMPKKIEFNMKVLEDDESLQEQEDKLRKPFHDDEEVDERIKEAITSIKDGLDTIQDQQRVDRNRQSLHSATNRSSHNGVVVDSIVETVVFILSLLFQVFFVRRWFLTRPGSAKMKTGNYAA